MDTRKPPPIPATPAITEPAAREPLAGREFGYEWRIASHLAFTFEVPRTLVERALPAGVELVEPVPDRALLNLIHARYSPGTLGEPKVFDEVVCSVLVQPDLTAAMPPPRLTLCVLDVVSNSRIFVNYKQPALQMPVRFDASLRGEMDADGLGSHVSDGRGEMFRVRCGEASPRFSDKAFCGQYFAHRMGRLYHGVWRWRGALHETQRHRRDAGTIHAHPWFSELGLDGLSARECYMQQASRPGEVVHMETFTPRSAQ